MSGDKSHTNPVFEKIFNEVNAEVTEDIVYKAGLAKLSEVAANIGGLLFDKKHRVFTGDLSKIVKVHDYLDNNISIMPGKGNNRHGGQGEVAHDGSTNPKGIYRQTSVESDSKEVRYTEDGLSQSANSSFLHGHASNNDEPLQGSSASNQQCNENDALHHHDNHFSSESDVKPLNLNPESTASERDAVIDKSKGAIPKRASGVEATGSSSPEIGPTKNSAVSNGENRNESDASSGLLAENEKLSSFEVSISSTVWQFRCQITDRPIKYDKITVEIDKLPEGKLILTGPKPKLEKEASELIQFNRTIQQNVTFTEIDLTPYIKKINEVKNIVDSLKSTEMYKNITMWIMDINEKKTLMVAIPKNREETQIISSLMEKLRALNQSRRRRNMKLEDGYNTFQNEQGQNIHCLPADVTNLSVDAIICSCDSYLGNKVGLAKAVANAAGPSFQEECKNFIKKHKILSHETVAVLGGHGLAVKKVVLLATPQRVTDGKRLAHLLNIALDQIARLGLSSVAVPAIGSGQTGMTKSEVVKAICQTILAFSSNMSSIKDFLLVDVGKELPKEFALYMKSVAKENKLSLLANPSCDRFIKSDQGASKPESTFGPPQITEWGQEGAQQMLNTDKDAANSWETEDDCVICMSKITNPQKLPCGHEFCADCIAQWIKEKPQCPRCNKVFGIITGNQPYGTMKVLSLRQKLPGHATDSNGTLQIDYDFPQGIQKEGHPNPGNTYPSCHRTAYLPDNQEGQEILRLLKTAFKSKALFTIGRSVTTGKDGRVTWNDVHHKTKMYGGPAAFGYPDPTYLKRVREELAAKGIK